MLSDILNIIISLPSQHVIFGIISTVLCIAVAWVDETPLVRAPC